MSTKRRIGVRSRRRRTLGTRGTDAGGRPPHARDGAANAKCQGASLKLSCLWEVPRLGRQDASALSHPRHRSNKAGVSSSSVSNVSSGTSRNPYFAPGKLCAFGIWAVSPFSAVVSERSFVLLLVTTSQKLSLEHARESSIAAMKAQFAAAARQ